MKQDKINLTPEEQLQVAIDKAKKKYGKVYKLCLWCSSRYYDDFS